VTPDVTTTYTIRATDKLSGCYAEDAATISPISKIYIPSAFTPNNDGTNDKWEIPGLALYPDALVTVFNRWGEKVYQSKAYFSHPWNGFFKGQMQPGVYVYLVQLNDASKQIFEGTVTLIR
jgi:gliding motility-associated-like protein